MQFCIVLYFLPEKPIDLVNKRGLAILITCNYEGSPLKEKLFTETEMDFTKMKATFDQFDYDVHARQNSEATVNAVDDLMARISSELSQYGTHTHAGKSDKVIIFAFSGHGDKDNIILHDGSFSITQDVLDRLLVRNNVVFEIPKLFFINACRGGDELKKAMKRVDFIEEKGNYRFDYATIPDHVSYAESKWMVKLAGKLIDPVEGNDSIQNVSAKVKRDIVEADEGHQLQLQQCESVDRLNTGPLKLYFKKK